MVEKINIINNKWSKQKQASVTCLALLKNSNKEWSLKTSQHLSQNVLVLVSKTIAKCILTPKKRIVFKHVIQRVLNSRPISIKNLPFSLEIFDNN